MLILCLLQVKYRAAHIREGLRERADAAIARVAQPAAEAFADVFVVIAGILHRLAADPAGLADHLATRLLMANALRYPVLRARDAPAVADVAQAVLAAVALYAGIAGAAFPYIFSHISGHG